MLFFFKCKNKTNLSMQTGYLRSPLPLTWRARVDRKELTLPFSLYSPMMEITDGRMSLHGDSTWVVLRERVDFFTMWYS